MIATLLSQRATQDLFNPHCPNKSNKEIVNSTQNYTKTYAIKNKCLTISSSTKNKTQNCIKWVLNSDAVDHMTENLNLLSNYCKINDDQFFMVANNEKKTKIKG
jgi:hypothetical protein